MSLLGEVPRLGGFVRTRGKLGFVPQTNWIFSATFRENIMFGLEMDRRKYNKVLYACDLVKVSTILPILLFYLFDSNFIATLHIT